MSRQCLWRQYLLIKGKCYVYIKKILNKPDDDWLKQMVNFLKKDNSGLTKQIQKTLTESLNDIRSMPNAIWRAKVNEATKKQWMRQRETSVYAWHVMGKKQQQKPTGRDKIRQLQSKPNYASSKEEPLFMQSSYHVNVWNVRLYQKFQNESWWN